MYVLLCCVFYECVCVCVGIHDAEWLPPVSLAPPRQLSDPTEWTLYSALPPPHLVLVSASYWSIQVGMLNKSTVKCKWEINLVLMQT